MFPFIRLCGKRLKGKHCYGKINYFLEGSSQSSVSTASVDFG